jgi:hypothetical protein
MSIQVPVILILHSGRRIAAVLSAGFRCPETLRLFGGSHNSGGPWGGRRRAGEAHVCATRQGAGRDKIT